jgi:signal peptidase I
VTKAGKSLARSVIELVAAVAVSLGIALAVEAFVVKPYRIPSGSMLPTLALGQRILVNRLGSTFEAPHVGDIVVFHPPASYANGCADPAEGENGDGQPASEACDVAGGKQSSETFVKRVVGLPGDRLSIVDGHVYRNGARERDAYTEPCGGAPSCDFPVTITVPKGDYYMMGDNRGESDDSRFWGPVPRGWIIGKVFFTYWPPSRIGFM